MDEPTILILNGLVEKCETARRFCKTALEVDHDPSLDPLLTGIAESYERVVDALREGLFAATGEAKGEGTVSGYFNRIAETAGQKGGWRDETQLIASLDERQDEVLKAFDAALADIADKRIGSILAAQRTVLSGLKKQTEIARANG
jgi:uncharacterized protein (TIGR02284 family)